MGVFYCNKCSNPLEPVEMLKDGRCAMVCKCSPNEVILVFTEITTEECKQIVNNLDNNLGFLLFMMTKQKNQKRTTKLI